MSCTVLLVLSNNTTIITINTFSIQAMFPADWRNRGSGVTGHRLATQTPHMARFETSYLCLAGFEATYTIIVAHPGDLSLIGANERSEEVTLLNKKIKKSYSNKNVILRSGRSSHDCWRCAPTPHRAHSTTHSAQTQAEDSS